jgi:hypothetical protein
MSRHNNKYSTEKEVYIVDQYVNEGKNTVEIAKELDTYNTTIRRILLRNNVELISTADRLRKVKYNPFSNDCRDTDYWVGMIAADGNVARDRPYIRLHSKDKIVLDQLKTFLRSDVNIHVETKLNTDYVGYVIGFTNLEAADYLQELGIGPNKSLTFKYNAPLNWDFVRGVFDGDGTIYRENKGNNMRFSICSASVEFINQLYDFFTDQGMTAHIKEDNREFRKNTLYSVHIYKQSNINECYNLMYNDTTVFLPRKESRFGSN